MSYAAPVTLLRLALRALLAGPGRLRGDAEAAVRRAARLRGGTWERGIDALRARLAADETVIDVVDYGAGSSDGSGAQRRVCDVAARAGTGPAWGRFLTGLARELAPRRVLELGTNLGLGAAHLCAGLAETGSDARLVTLEGDPSFAAIAADALETLGYADRVDIVVGRFADTLPGVCAAHGPFDLVFIDGHHAEQPALDYVATLRPHLADGAVVVLDDVEPGRPVRRAWARLAAEPGARRRYLGKLGLLHLPTRRTEGAAAAAPRSTVLT